MWKVTSNFICGEKMYQVYKLRDASKTDHSGNRKYATGLMKNKQEASKVASELNRA